MPADVTTRVIMFCVHIDRVLNLLALYRRYILEHMLRGAAWTSSPFQYLVEQNRYHRWTERNGIFYSTNKHEPIDIILCCLPA